VLGCTHYPVLHQTIAKVAEQIAGRAVPIVDSAAATALSVAGLCAEGRIPAAPAADGSAESRLEILVTDLPASFAAMAERCLGGEVPSVTQIDLQ
jgi:glutamate racemase